MADCGEAEPRREARRGPLIPDQHADSHRHLAVEPDHVRIGKEHATMAIGTSERTCLIRAMDIDEAATCVDDATFGIDPLVKACL